MKSTVKVGSLDDFSATTTKEFLVGGRSLVGALINGKPVLYENTCSHAQAMLSGLDIIEGSVRCPLHGAKFAIENGAALTPPAFEPLTRIEVTIADNVVYAQID